MNLNVIGYVESCYLDKFGTPRQPGLVEESRAFLRIRPEFQPQDSLVGLSEFSHLWVLFYFHKNHPSTQFHAKVHPPRLEGNKMGLFATRSPHRPNPIGLSLVKIESVEKDGVWVRGIDMIDQTPILDLKPYLPYAEAKPEAMASYATQAPARISKIHFLCQEKLEKWKQKRPEVEALIQRTLELDPRPQVYKGYEGKGSPHREKHAMRLYEGDVHFQFLTPDEVEVFDIRFMNDEFQDSY